MYYLYNTNGGDRSLDFCSSNSGIDDVGQRIVFLFSFFVFSYAQIYFWGNIPMMPKRDISEAVLNFNVVKWLPQPVWEVWHVRSQCKSPKAQMLTILEIRVSQLCQQPTKSYKNTKFIVWLWFCLTWHMRGPQAPPCLTCLQKEDPWGREGGRR